jgi:hypothetical protein
LEKNITSDLAQFLTSPSVPGNVDVAVPFNALVATTNCNEQIHAFNSEKTEGSKDS